LRDFHISYVKSRPSGKQKLKFLMSRIAWSGGFPGDLSEDFSAATYCFMITAKVKLYSKFLVTPNYSLCYSHKSATLQFEFSIMILYVSAFQV